MKLRNALMQAVVELSPNEAQSLSVFFTIGDIKRKTKRSRVERFLTLRLSDPSREENVTDLVDFIGVAKRISLYRFGMRFVHLVSSSAHNNNALYWVEERMAIISWIQEKITTILRLRRQPATLAVLIAGIDNDENVPPRMIKDLKRSRLHKLILLTVRIMLEQQGGIVTDGNAYSLK